MDAFSAHADRDGLLTYAAFTPPEKLKHIFLVHGELEQAMPLRDALKARGYARVDVPAPRETFEV